MKIITTYVFRSIVAALLIALGIGGANAGGKDYGKTASIVQVAQDAGQFDTLVAAVKAAGLVDTLQGEGPFTVFAPTDAAFDKLPDGTVDTLLQPENREKLKSILLYHVVSGKVMAKQATEIDSAETVGGGKLALSTTDGKVMVNEATVITPDVEASNGVIHVIDTVLMPN